MKSRFLRNVARAVTALFFSASVHAAVSDIAQAPLVTSPSSSVQPNMMYLLDDSGSMDWDYLPDWATTSDQTLFRNNAYNGVAYSPDITYTPPTYYNSDGTLNTTKYPSQGSPWTAVPNDGYKVQSTSTSNLVGNAYYYTWVAGEYCTTPRLFSTTPIPQHHPPASASQRLRPPTPTRRNCAGAPTAPRPLARRSGSSRAPNTSGRATRRRPRPPFRSAAAIPPR